MVSLENEYFAIKTELKSEKEKLEKIQATEIAEDENNPFSIEERIEAKNRAIEGYKANIKECEEILEEIKEELIEFIENGGEVSEKTKEAINYFEPIRVDFKIVSNKNENVYCEGYVTINDEKAEDVDWYYWTGEGYQSRPFYHHNQEEITGLTHEQHSEIDKFIIDYADDSLWIDTAILQSNENDNRTFIRENCTLIINDGAKFEVETCEYDPSDFYDEYSNAFEIDREYYLTFKPKFNNESVVDLIEEYIEYGILTNPFTCDDICNEVDFNKNSIAIEVPKSFFEWSDAYNEDDVELTISEFSDALEEAYKKALAHDKSIFGIAVNMYEEKLKKENDMKIFDESHIQDFGNAWEDSYVEYEDILTLYTLTEQDIENAIKEDWKEQEKYYEGYE